MWRRDGGVTRKERGRVGQSENKKILCDLLVALTVVPQDTNQTEVRGKEWEICWDFLLRKNLIVLVLSRTVNYPL